MSHCSGTPGANRYLGRYRPALGEVAAQVRKGAVPGGLRRIGVVVAERVLLVAERVTGAGIDDELHVLTHALQLRLELLHRAWAEEVIVLREVTLHRGGQAVPVRRHVAERCAVEGCGGGDLV